MPLSNNPRYWFVIPAAGIGARMNAAKPKQYLVLGKQTILEHTLSRILLLPNVAGIVVAVSADDCFWRSLSVFQHPLIHTTLGGESRAESVLSGLTYIEKQAHAYDWVLVHDAARPCVTLSSINKLRDSLVDSEVGGILSVPVSDTIKQVSNAHEIQTTVDRNSLWQAQTPQMFRYKLLRDCLAKTLASNENITDESSSVEVCGYKPLVVEGRSDNIKVTRPDDLLLAEFILYKQEKEL